MAETPFEQTVARAQALLTFHRRLHGKRARPEAGLSDLSRGALVLAVAGLDAHIVDLVCRAVPHLARQGRLGDDVAKWVEKNSVATGACFGADDPHTALGDLARSHLGELTFQKAQMIEGVLRGAVGCSPPWEREVAGSTPAPATITDQVEQAGLLREAADGFGAPNPQPILVLPPRNPRSRSRSSPTCWR